MWQSFKSMFIPASSMISTDPLLVDPREPDVPRTPPALWKGRKNLNIFDEAGDPRSPTMGIPRSPVMRYTKERMISFEEKQNVQHQVVEEEKAKDELVEVPRVPMPEPQQPQVDVESELAKLRQEFSTKREVQSSPASSTTTTPMKMFMSSPALWKNVVSSPNLLGTPKGEHNSDPLLGGGGVWTASPARRSLFTRSDSASAA